MPGCQHSVHVCICASQSLQTTDFTQPFLLITTVFQNVQLEICREIMVEHLVFSCPSTDSAVEVVVERGVSWLVRSYDSSCRDREKRT
jgi:hypothetical protein